MRGFERQQGWRHLLRLGYEMTVRKGGKVHHVQEVARVPGDNSKRATPKADGARAERRAWAREQERALRSRTPAQEHP
jgi:hypothetical protein